MSKIRAAIRGVHAWVPEYRLTNAELETMVDTNDEWIVSRTGIKERRILKGEGLGSSDIGVEAVKGLLEKTGTKATEIDFLLCATTTPDMQFPATANIICDKIGAKNAFGFDLNAACSGFIYALITATKFIESGTHKKIVVVGADKMSSIIDYTDRRTCIIFGDGGGAVLLEAATDEDGIHDAALYSDGAGREYLYKKGGGSAYPATVENVTAGEHFVFQDGRPVFKAAVKGMSSAIETVLKNNNLNVENLDWLVPHQANKRILDSVASMIDIDPAKVVINIEKYGNTTNGTIPLCLWEWEDKLKKGDKIMLAAFGGGFTWGAVYLTWAY